MPHQHPSPLGPRHHGTPAGPEWIVAVHDDDLPRTEYARHLAVLGDVLTGSTYAEACGGRRLGTLAEIMAASDDAKGPFVPTEHPDLAVFIDHNGLRLRAVIRACPHRGYDLTEDGSLTPDGQTLACRHRAYSWAAADGRRLSCGHRGPTGALTFLPTRIDDDGVVWTTPTDVEVPS